MNDYSYLYDGKGNVMVVIDSNQQPVAYYRYDVFGVPMKKVGTFNQPFRFSTKRYDKATGLYNFGYRFHNPIIGRWMTRDPLGEAGGINLYGFVGNNPINYTDPWGLWRTKDHNKIIDDTFSALPKAHRDAIKRVENRCQILNFSVFYKVCRKNRFKPIIYNRD